MASKIICLFATILHLALRLSMFIEQPALVCTAPTPAIASLLIFCSVILLLIDNQIFPERHLNDSITPVRVFLETIMVITILEFGMCFVWCKIEENIHILFKMVFMEKKLNMYYDMGGAVFTGFIITLISFAFLVNIMIITNTMKYWRGLAYILYDKIAAKFQFVWTSSDFRLCNEYWVNSNNKKMNGMSCAESEQKSNKCCEKIRSLLEGSTDNDNVRRSDRQRQKKLVCLFCEKDK